MFIFGNSLTIVVLFMLSSDAIIQDLRSIFKRGKRCVTLRRRPIAEIVSKIQRFLHITSDGPGGTVGRLS